MTQTAPLPPRDSLKILFAHNAYDMKPVFDARGLGITSRQVTTREALAEALPEADVLVASGFWKNELLALAPRLRFIQSVSSGTNQYDRDALAARGIRLASGQGVNVNAVSEHALGLLLSLTRQLALARDNQTRGYWRPEIPDAAIREDELPGKTMVIVGTGGIGDRIARLARAFDMRVIGVRRDPTKGAGHADAVHGLADLPQLLPEADVVVLSCPLTEETAGLIGPAALAAMKPTALLVNVARGGCVDEPALIAALNEGRIAGAGLDVTATEPLPADSPLWSMENVVLTSHAAGETRRYEANVVDLLVRNLDRLWAGETALVNQIV